MDKITISIVSHGHDELVKRLLLQLVNYNFYISKVIITNNIQHKINFSDFKSSLNIKVIQNNMPYGFGENHNRAFKYCNSKYYCVMNPDIKINQDPFNTMLKCSRANDIAIIAPLIKNLIGEVEDSARMFPTPSGLIKKIFGFYDGVFRINNSQCTNYPDWVGGMFMLYKSAFFKKLSGFDQSYFLYYEDVDICLRAWKSGYKVVLCKDAVVLHDARRESHRNIKFFKWHIVSLIIFFFKHLGRYPKVNI